MRFGVLRNLWFAWWVGLSLSPAIAAEVAEPDSAQHGDLLDELQRRDDAFFDDELLNFDFGFRDSALARFDSLGLRATQDQARRRWRLDADLEIASQLWDYNRAEGLVLAIGVRGGPLLLEGGYATASERGRYAASFRYRMAFARYADQVVPYGSNRPFANSLRALVGGEDAQDYLRRRGGEAGFSFQHWGLEMELGYAAARQTSVPVATGFSFAGHLDDEPIPPVTPGIDRGLVVRLAAGSLDDQRLRFELQHQVSGGGLGGDFTYNRSDARLEWRRFVPWRHELHVVHQFVQTGGTPPVQSLADIGGLSTLRGFDRRTQVGERSFATQAELLLPYPFAGPLKLQLVPWADAAQVDAWRYSAGLGIQRFLGSLGRASNLRFDIALPLGPERPDDVRFELRFASGLF